MKVFRHWFRLTVVSLAAVCLSPGSAVAQTLDLGSPPSNTGAVPKQGQLRARPLSVQSGWIDTANRLAVWNAYQNDFLPTGNVPMGWTGSLDSGDPGGTSGAFKQAVMQRVNWFRAMAGTPAWIALNDEFSGKAQQAALMMSANKAINHFPPANWTFYTAEAAEAAQNSNLCMRTSATGVFEDTGCVAAYIEDPGAENFAVGHRRWILNPPTREMGTGDIPQVGEFPNTNSLWVFDSHIFDFRPPTREEFVAWPPSGYVPRDVVYDKWSFSVRYADFTAATISMERDGQPVPLQIEPLDQGYGENAIAWVPGDGVAPAANGSGDVRTRVTVSDVLVGGALREFTYEVIAFDSNAAVNPVFSAAGLVNSASFTPGPPPPDAWEDLFGENLANQFVLDGSFPTSLDGSSITITDSQNVSYQARIHFVTPSRIQFLTPPGMASGPATIRVTNSTGGSATANIKIASVAPGVFAANANGQGPAAATWLRIAGDGTRTGDFTFTLDAPPNRANVPIDLGPATDQIYLSLYGTGFRGQSSVSCTIGGMAVPVLGAVAQGEFDGLDQAVVGPLPRELAGRGNVNVEFTFNAVKANTVTVSIQ